MASFIFSLPAHCLLAIRQISAGQALKRRQTEEDRKMKTAQCILLAACLFVATVSSHPHPLGKVNIVFNRSMKPEISQSLLDWHLAFQPCHKVTASG